MPRRTRSPDRKRPPRKRATPSYKLPDSKLSPTQLQNRRRIRTRRRLDKDPLYNPQTPLAGANLKTAVDKIVTGEFAPVENQLRRRMSDTTTQGAALQGRAADYYAQLAAQEQRGIQTQQALGSMLSSRVGQIGEQAQQTALAAQHAEQQRLTQDAAVRGPGLQDPSTLKETGVIAANAAQNAAVARTQAEQGTSNWANLAATMAQARGLRGGEVQERLANRVLNANALTQNDLADLAVRKGGATSKTLMDLRQRGFENIATAQTLNLKGQDLALEAQENKTQAQIARDRLREARRATNARIGTTRRGQDISARTAAENRAAADRRAEASLAARRGGGPAGETPAQRAKRKQMAIDASTAGADARTLINTPVPVRGPDGKPDPDGKKRRLTEAEVRAAMRDRYKDRDIANTALDLAVLGYISPTNERRLRGRNIPIDPEWLRKRPKRKRRGPQGLPGSST